MRLRFAEHNRVIFDDFEDYYFSEYKWLKEEQGIADDREHHYDTPCTVDNQKIILARAGFVNIREVWRKENTIILLADKQVE